MSDSQSPEKKAFSDLWWFVLLRGIILVALGIVFLTRPETPLTVVILVMGFYWFIDGILTVIKAIKERNTNRYWGFSLFVGIVSIIAGVVIFSQPAASALFTTTFLVYFVAAAALISGLTSLITGIRMRNEINNEMYLIIGGSVSILFSILLFSSPQTTVLFLVKALGVIALIVGIIQVIYAFKVRSAAKQLGA